MSRPLTSIVTVFQNRDLNYRADEGKFQWFSILNNAIGLGMRIFGNKNILFSANFSYDIYSIIQIELIRQFATNP